MEMTVYNPQKGRLETIDAEFTDENTTWFNNSTNDLDIHMIADLEGDLLISELDYTYPFKIHNMSRADIGYDQRNAMELKRLYE